jgi:hypothetical protein
LFFRKLKTWTNQYQVDKLVQESFHHPQFHHVHQRMKIIFIVFFVTNFSRTIPNTINQSNVFPPTDEFNQSPLNSLSIRDNLSFPTDSI